MRRLGRRIGALALALVVGGVAVPLASPTPAGALGCTLPGTSIPCSSLVKGGIPTDTAGAETVAGAAAAEGPNPVGLGVAAFAGGYQVGCWLGSLMWSGGSCNPLNMFNFGSKGDNRTTTLAGSSLNPAYQGLVKTYGGVNYTLEPAPGITNMTLTLGSQTTGADVYFDEKIVCENTSTGATRNYLYFQNQLWHSSSSSWGFNTQNGQWCGQSSPGYPANSGPEQLVGAYTYVPTGSSTLVVQWTYDYGNGTPWTVTYTETCGTGSSTATASSTVTFTPAASGAMPAPTNLPSCQSILPGSNLWTVKATGGRNGVSEITLTQPTWDPAITSAYPLCTTSAPAGGCFLDLQRNGKSCFDGTTICAGWRQYESAMTCLWGPYTVPIKWCEDDYTPTFDTEVVAQPGSQPSATGSPAGGSLPTTGTNPYTDPTNAPADDHGGIGCLGGMWSWNPYDCVFTPVKCVIIWCCVPRMSVIQADWTQAYGDISGRPPISVVVAGGTLAHDFASSAASGSCSGNLAEFHIQNGGGQDVIPCNPPDWLETWLGSVQTISSVALVVWAAFILWHMVEGALGDH